MEDGLQYVASGVYLDDCDDKFVFDAADPQKSKISLADGNLSESMPDDSLCDSMVQCLYINHWLAIDDLSLT